MKFKYAALLTLAFVVLGGICLAFESRISKKDPSAMAAVQKMLAHVEKVVKDKDDEGMVLKHTFWQDALKFDSKDRIHLSQRPEEKATVLEQTDAKITLHWDGWNTKETFLKEPGGLWVLKKREALPEKK